MNIFNSFSSYILSRKYLGLIFFIFCFDIMLSADEAFNTHVTYNLDNTRSVELVNGWAKTAFQNFTFKNRYPALIKQISELLPDSMTLQEVSSLHLPILKEDLEALGYEVIMNPYNESRDENCFWLVTAIKKARYSVLVMATIPFTLDALPSKTEEEWREYIKLQQQSEEALSELEKIEQTKEEEQRVKELKALINCARSEKQSLFEHNLGTEFEKSAQITILMEKETSKILTLINVHFGLTLKNRFFCSLILQKIVKEILNNPKTMSIIVSGDMNTFPEQGGREQIKIAGFKEFTSMIKWESGENQPVSTIIPRPYDPILQPYSKSEWKFIEETNELNENEAAKSIWNFIIARHKNRPPLMGHLDRILGENITVLSVTVHNKDLVGNFFPIDSELLQQLIYDQELPIPLTPSDHLPVEMHFNLNSDTETTIPIYIIPTEKEFIDSFVTEADETAKHQHRSIQECSENARKAAQEIYPEIKQFSKHLDENKIIEQQIDHFFSL